MPGIYLYIVLNKFVSLVKLGAVNISDIDLGPRDAES